LTDLAAGVVMADPRGGRILRSGAAMGAEAEPGREAETEEAAQAPVVDFLASDAWAGERPEHVVTHLSHVFLAAGRVLKLKRARRLPFVDYSTLPARRRFCQREMEVNAPFAAPLYVGVAAITRGPDGLLLDGAGEAVDYAVEMRRFDPDHQLDRMVDRGALGPDLMDDLGTAVARMHADVPVVRVRGGSERVDRVRRQLAGDLSAVLGASDLAERVDRWSLHAKVEVDALAGLLDRRGRHGFVRRCHGDLHLSNICLWEGRPMPFDAIEFDEELATVDVLYDLAFVLVDLDHRGRADLSSRLLSRTLELTRDYSGLAVLPLFLSLRAMVRALTRAMKEEDPAPHVAQAERALHSPSPRLVAVGGLSGTGKTTVARALAPALGAVVIRSDTARKRLAGVADEERLPPSAYTSKLREKVYRRMLVDARRALRAGAPVILDATFMEPSWRQAAEAAADAEGVPFAGLWLEAPVEILGRRVAARSGDASDADVAVVRAQREIDAGPLAWSRVDAGGRPGEVAEHAAAALPAAPPAERTGRLA